MTEHPILFSAPMVRAILDGSKTQTRRVFKGTKEFKGPYNPAYLERWKGNEGWKQIGPYGKPGDALWVKETFAVNCCPWNKGRLPKKKPQDLNGPAEILYRADGELGDQVEIDDSDGELPWRPSIFMPRWASRILLEITDVRVQRVQEISEEDAKAEGVRFLNPYWDKEFDGQFHLAGFADLWDSINAKRGHGWETNPWVWAISFRRIKP